MQIFIHYGKTKILSMGELNNIFNENCVFEEIIHRKEIPF